MGRVSIGKHAIEERGNGEALGWILSDGDKDRVWNWIELTRTRTLIDRVRRRGWMIIKHGKKEKNIWLWRLVNTFNPGVWVRETMQ